MFSLAGSSLTDSLTRSTASMQIVSGITESHKLEQEQLGLPKMQQQKPIRKVQSRNKPIPSQPVVMPRTAHLVNDAEDQYSGLEFGSVPLSPNTKQDGSHQEQNISR